MLYKTLNVHMARPYPKRAAGVAMINAIGGLSNIWTAYLYFGQHRTIETHPGAPLYTYTYPY